MRRTSFLSISSVPARVTGRSERISSVIQSSWTLREAMTKKGRCSVFRQRPFDVSATTGYCGIFALGRRIFIAYFGSAGKIGNLRAHPDFTNKTAGHRSSKPGSGRSISVFPRTSGTARRKYAANSGTHEHTALFA